MFQGVRRDEAVAENVEARFERGAHEASGEGCFVVAVGEDRGNGLVGQRRDRYKWC